MQLSGTDVSYMDPQHPALLVCWDYFPGYENSSYALHNPEGPCMRHLSLKALPHVEQTT
jgi:hypothetical protein